jgi:acyl-CoA thioesterase I
MRLIFIFLLFLNPAFAQVGGQVKLLSFGDSLTAGYGLREHEAFPAQLEKLLQGKAVILNAGVSGDTTQGGLERVDWAMTPEIKGVILELGANDMLRAVSPQITRQNLEKLIVFFQSKGVKVFLCGMLASPNLGENFTLPYNKIFSDLAKQYDLDFDPFFMEGVAGNPSLLLKDGMHPNAEGVGVIAKRLAPKILRFIEKIK